MNFNEIDRLLERYLEGSTSLGEEQILQDFFSQKDLPDRYRPYCEMFQGFKAVSTGRLNDRRFEKEWLSRLKEKSGASRSIFSTSRWYIISGIAATILLVILLVIPFKKLPVMNLFSQKIEDTFDDPRQAYQVTIQALLTVSEKFNAGTDQMKGLNKLDKGLQEAGKMLTFNKGIKKVRELDRLNKDASPVEKLSKMDEGRKEAEKLSKFKEEQLEINNL